MVEDNRRDRRKLVWFRHALFFYGEVVLIVVVNYLAGGLTKG